MAQPSRSDMQRTCSAGLPGEAPAERLCYVQLPGAKIPSDGVCHVGGEVFPFGSPATKNQLYLSSPFVGLPGDLGSEVKVQIRRLKS